jgi:hypothetical protein
MLAVSFKLEIEHLETLREVSPKLGESLIYGVLIL